MNKNIYKNVVVPESVLLKVERPNRYGSIRGLEDEELALPDELEKMVYREQFRPILALPSKAGKCSIGLVMDEDGGIEWGAFGTVDFDRYRPKLDKTRYKAEKLKERLKDLGILIFIVNDRIQGNTKLKVLKYLKKGILDLGDICDFDMYQLGQMYLRGLGLCREISELQQASAGRRQRHVKVWLNSLD